MRTICFFTTNRRKHHEISELLIAAIVEIVHPKLDAVFHWPQLDVSNAGCCHARHAAHEVLNALAASKRRYHEGRIQVAHGFVCDLARRLGAAGQAGQGNFDGVGDLAFVEQQFVGRHALERAVHEQRCQLDAAALRIQMLTRGVFEAH